MLVTSNLSIISNLRLAVVLPGLATSFFDSRYRRSRRFLSSSVRGGLALSRIELSELRRGFPSLPSAAGSAKTSTSPVGLCRRCLSSAESDGRCCGPGGRANGRIGNPLGGGRRVPFKGLGGTIALACDDGVGCKFIRACDLVRAVVVFVRQSIIPQGRRVCLL